MQKSSDDMLTMLKFAMSREMLTANSECSDCGGR